MLGLYGLIGAGRSEWAQAVFGLREIAGGEVYVGEQRVTGQGAGAMVRQGVAYVPEDRLRQGLCRGLSVTTNVVLATLRRLSWGPWLLPGRENRQTATAIEQLAIRLRSPGQPVGTLSGGNQQKVILGRWLGCDPSVLILDEPTRGVDVGAKAEIHALVRRLADEGRAVVFISSDLPEVLTQSDRVGVFREGRLVAEFAAREASAEAVAAAALPASGVASAPRGQDISVGYDSNRVMPDTIGIVSHGRKSRGANALASRESVLLIVLIVLFALLQFRTDNFLEPARVRDLLEESVLLGFCALARGW